MTTPRQDENGTPFMEYFDPNAQISFIWDGLSPVIQLCEGASGEEVSAEFTPFDIDVARGGTAAGILGWFQAQCLAYLIMERADAISRGETP